MGIMFVVEENAIKIRKTTGKIVYYVLVGVYAYTDRVG